MTDIAAEIGAWFRGRLPGDWFVDGAVDVAVDREEITVVGVLEPPALPESTSDVERASATAGRIAAFREETRDRRMAIAREAEHRFGRKVAWGVRSGAHRELFTHLSVPVMTRLRQPERQVLDTLVEAGVARSRSDALAWCVRLVGRHTGDWLSDLREAMTEVQRLREAGPGGSSGPSSSSGRG